MGDAGITLFESFGNDIHHNIVEGSRYGVRMVLGSAENMVHDNEFKSNSDGEALVPINPIRRLRLIHTSRRVDLI